MPKDRISGVHQFYGFVEFLSEDDADYAIKVLNMIKLFGKPIRVNKAASNERTTDVGANLFVRPHPYRWRLGVGACSSHESAEASPWFWSRFAALACLLGSGVSVCFSSLSCQCCQCLLRPSPHLHLLNTHTHTPQHTSCDDATCMPEPKQHQPWKQQANNPV